MLREFTGQVVFEPPVGRALNRTAFQPASDRNKGANRGASPILVVTRRRAQLALSGLSRDQRETILRHWGNWPAKRFEVSNLARSRFVVEGQLHASAADGGSELAAAIPILGMLDLGDEAGGVLGPNVNNDLGVLGLERYGQAVAILAPIDFK